MPLRALAHEINGSNTPSPPPPLPSLAQSLSAELIEAGLGKGGIDAIQEPPYRDTLLGTKQAEMILTLTLTLTLTLIFQP